MKDWNDPDEPSSRWAKLEALLLGILYVIAAAALVAGVLGWTRLGAHPGSLAADGCYNDRKNGGRHCHRRTWAGRTLAPPRGGAVAYPHCDAARAAGAAPLYQGQPGYSSRLDRDGDGEACE